MKWFHMRGPGGTITVKAEFSAQAVHEAAERWGCDPDGIQVTGEEPYYGSGEPVPVSLEMGIAALEKAGVI